MKRAHKLTYISILVAQALILHIVEGMLPIPFIAPGAKLGLSNIINIIALYYFNFSDALLVLSLRIILSSLIGGTLSSFMYAITGGLFSLLAMTAVKKLGGKYVSIMGVSMVGAFFHNVGQILVAAIIIENLKIIIYLPIITLSALGTGFFIGLTANYLIIFMKKLPIHKRMNIKGD